MNKRRLVYLRNFARRVWGLSIRFTCSDTNPALLLVVWAILAVLFYTGTPLTLIVGSQLPIIIRFPKNELLAILASVLAVINSELFIAKLRNRKKVVSERCVCEKVKDIIYEKD